MHTPTKLVGRGATNTQKAKHKTQNKTHIPNQGTTKKKPVTQKKTQKKKRHERPNIITILSLK